VKGPADPSFKYLDLLANKGTGPNDSGTPSILMDRDTSNNQHPSTGLPNGAETTALGHALESATVGLPYDDTSGQPMPPHTKEMSSVMSDVVAKFGGGDGPKLLHGKDALFGNLNGSLGDMTAAYMGDVQSAVSNTNMPTNGVPANLNAADTAKLVGTLGRDPGAYGTIAQAQQAYTTAQIQDVMTHRGDHPELSTALDDRVHPGGIVQGLISSGKASEILQNQQAHDAAYNAAVDQKAGWAAKVWDVTGGKAVGNIPVAGGYLNGKIDGIITGADAAYKIDTSGASTDKATDAMTGGASLSAKQAVLTAAQGTDIGQSYAQDLADHVVASGQDGFTAGYALFHGGKDA
jgi:hypothetical protein